MDKIDKIKNELNKMINDKRFLYDDELVEVSQFLDKMLIEHIKSMECKTMLYEKKDYELEFDEFIDILPCAIYVIRESIIIDCNKAALNIFGYDNKKEIIGFMPYELSPKYQDDGNLSIIKGQHIIEDILNSKKTSEFQWKHKRRCGEVFLSEIIIYNKNGTLYAIIADINENIKLKDDLNVEIDDKMKQKLMFDKLLTASPYAVAILDKEQKIVNVNDNFTKLFQHHDYEIKGKYINRLVSPYDYSQVDNNIELIYKGKVVKQEGKRKCKDGSLVDVEIIGYPVLYHQAVIGVYILYIDISDKKRYEEQLHLFKKVLENNSEGVFITDYNGHIEWINNAFTEITGYSLGDVLYKKTNILKSGLHDTEFYNEMWNQLLQNGNWKGEIWNKNKNGDIFTGWLSINSIIDNKNNITHFVGIYKDLSEKKKIDKRMIELQQKDILTGLYNRNYFINIVDKYIEDYKENCEEFSIIVIDIEGFKDINDSLGHIIGDNLLIEMSDRINNYLYGEYVISRVDGDEFAILTKKATIKDLKLLIKQLLEKLNKPYYISNTIIYLNFNIGICRYPEYGTDSEALLRFANVAMNRSKKNLGDRVCFYSVEISQEIEQKFYLANYLFGALTNNELSIYYQPIFDIKEKCLVGVEALLRWDSPILGDTSPELFIPIAEKTGQILKIGEWVINEVCKQIYIWEQKGYEIVPVSINVSVKQLELESFSKTILNIIDGNHIKPESIEIEITESVSSGDINKIIKNINDLKVSGIKISMDDFGTGFSSLGQLNIFQLDKLKIDKIFINDLVNGLKRQNLVKSIIAMAKSLNLVTVAEGIETSEQLYQLKGLGCQLGQGYIFSKPLSVVDFEVLLNQNKEFKYKNT